MQKVKKIVKSPKVREAITQMKPNRTIWGFLGVVLFFIVPEIVGFVWGNEIAQYANKALQNNPSASMEAYFKALVMLFEDGGSWINLLIGVALLVWLFF
ncbi:MAG: hypothetical protein U9P71_05980 [Campylobacterota bacterium]|nr:hypothetical protein [Campylobacterota bacterium]